jgi:short-subunit dehydrogenase
LAARTRLDLGQCGGGDRGLAGSRISVTALGPEATETAFFAADGAVKATLIARLGMASAALVAAAGWAAMQKSKQVKVPGILNVIFANLPRFALRVLVAWIAQIFLKRRK